MCVRQTYVYTQQHLIQNRPSFWSNLSFMEHMAVLPGLKTRPLGNYSELEKPSRNLLNPCQTWGFPEMGTPRSSNHPFYR